MSKNTELKAAIDLTIKSNGVGAITGPVLNAALTQMLGGYPSDSDAALMNITGAATPINGGGSITLTNGANTIAGAGTQFTLSTNPGDLGYWGYLSVLDTSGDVYLLQGIQVTDDNTATFDQHYNITQNPKGFFDGSGDLGANWTGQTLTAPATVYLNQAAGTSISWGIGNVVNDTDVDLLNVSLGFQNFARTSSGLIVGRVNTVQGTRPVIFGADNFADLSNYAFIFGQANEVKDGAVPGQETFVFGRLNNVTGGGKTVIGRNNTVTDNNAGTVVLGQFITFKHADNCAALACKTSTIGTATATGKPVNVTFIGYDSAQLDDQGLSNTVSMPTAHLGADTISRDYADDTAAAVGGVPVGGVYHNAGVLRIRLV